MLSWHIRIFFILFLSSIFLMKTNHGKVWSTPYRSPYCPRDFHGQLFLAHGVIIDVVVFVPKGHGDYDHSFAWKPGQLWCGYFQGGGWLLDPGEKTSRCKLTCVTLHDSYWQLVHFIPPPFSPIELVVVLYSFHGIGALMRRKPLSVSWLHKTFNKAVSRQL